MNELYAGIRLSKDVAIEAERLLTSLKEVKKRLQSLQTESAGDEVKEPQNDLHSLPVDIIINICKRVRCTASVCGLMKVPAISYCSFITCHWTSGLQASPILTDTMACRQPEPYIRGSPATIPCGSHYALIFGVSQADMLLKKGTQAAPSCNQQIMWTLNLKIRKTGEVSTSEHTR